MTERRIPYSRLWAIGLVTCLYFVTYVAVTRIIDRMPPAALWHWETPLDRWIPYLSWSWPGYWVAYPFVVIAGATAMLRMPAACFRRGVTAFGLMIFLGAVLHLSFPAPAPWPDHPHLVQRLAHASPLMRRWATLPSMHVALCTLTTFLCLGVSRSRRARFGAPAITLLVAVSTLTLKEHVVLDALTGMLLGSGVGYWWWRSLRRPDAMRTEALAPPDALRSGSASR